VQNEVVSFENEKLILVDTRDNEIGSLDKSSCHDGEGVLHRAFSLFIFNLEGDLLIQQRARNKRLWGGYWSNSVCSHPRVGEDMDTAVGRRLSQELGLVMPLSFAYKFEYQTKFNEEGTEHELCSVYVGHCDSQPKPNKTEIMAWRWIRPAELTQQLINKPELYTPWFKMEWQRLNQDHAALLSP